MIEMLRGPVLLLGCQGAGKTVEADKITFDLVNRSGAPLLTCDTGGVEAYQGQYHAQDLDELIEIVWTEGKHCCYTPKDPEDFDNLMGAVYGGRRVILKVDELKNVKPSGRPLSNNFRKVLGECRRVLVGCTITTQLYCDCGDAIHGLCWELYAYRMIGPECRAALRRQYGIEEAVLEKLPSAQECAQAGRPITDAYVYRKAGF